MEEDDVLPMDVWTYVQYDYRKVADDFSLVTTNPCNPEVGKQRWLRLYGHKHARKSLAALCLVETLDAALHKRPAEQAFGCPWIATRISSFIDRRRTYTCLSSLSSFMRNQLVGTALSTSALPWIQALKACRPCTTVFVGDDVAAMGLHILRMNEPSRRYVGAEVRISGTSNALVVLRVKRGRTSHIESATCLMTKDSDGVSACCALVGKRATLDAVTSKSGKNTCMYVFYRCQRRSFMLLA